MCEKLVEGPLRICAKAGMHETGTSINCGDSNLRRQLTEGGRE